MPTLYGLYGNQVIPQPLSYSKNEQGGVNASQSYYVRTQAVNEGYFKKGKSIVDIDPDANYKFAFLTVTSWDIADEEGEVSLVRVNYTGSASATYGESSLSPDALPVYRLSGTLVDAPLAEHPKWKALTAADKIRLGYLMDGTYKLNSSNKLGVVGEDGAFNQFGAENQLASGNAEKFAELIASGVMTYVRPSLTWSETAQGNDPLTQAQINKLGKVSNPRGDPPEPTGGRDWMLTSASQEQSGDLYQTSLEWQLSDEDGHDYFLYNPS
jgi:hypothetical protein